MSEDRPDIPTGATPPPPPPGTTPGSDGNVGRPGPGSGGPGPGGPETAGDSWAAGEPAPRSKRGGGFVAAVIVAAIVIVGGAALATTMFLLRGADEALATKVPASADLFGTIYLDPAASQKVNLFRLTDRFPALGNEEELKQRLTTFLDDSLEGRGVTSEDVLGWVGSQVGFAASIGSDEMHGALLVAADDAEQARASLEKLIDAGEIGEVTRGEYGGATLWTSSEDTTAAIVDDVVVFGSDRAFVEDVIDTANGDLEALDGSPRFEETLSDLPDAKLATLYVDVGSLVQTALDQASAAGALDAAGTAGLGGVDPEAFGGMGMSVAAQPNGLMVDVSVDVDSSKLPPEVRSQLEADPGPNELLDQTPVDSYGVIAQTGLDVAIQQAVANAGPALPQLEQIGLTGPDGVIEDLTGDMVLTVGPSDAGPIPTGALIVGTEDEAGMQVFLDTVAPMLVEGIGSSLPAEIETPGSVDAPVFRAPQPRWQTETYEGVTISSLVDPSLVEMGVRPAYAVANGAGILASSVEEIKKVIDTAIGESIETDTTFTQARGAVRGYDQSLAYVDVGGVVEAIQQADPSGTAIPPEVEENLAPIDALVVGTRADPDSQDSRMLLLIGG